MQTHGKSVDNMQVNIQQSSKKCPFSLTAHEQQTEHKCYFNRRTTDRFALSVVDEFLQLFEGGQPAVAIILSGDSAQEVGKPRLIWMSHPSVCKNKILDISSV